MSKHKRTRQAKAESITQESAPAVASAIESELTEATRFKKITAYLKAHLWLVAAICFLALGALGAGLKYLDESAQAELARRQAVKGNLNNQQDQSFLNRVNPFLPTPTPTPTPQLSKEYIYAGSRLLAVEDANANAAPPADLAVWRPASGEWWVMGQTGSQQVTQAWGVNGDVPVPGDYDGDGKTDFSVWREANGTWYIAGSAGGGGQFPLGTTGDLPAQADFDGDGRTDPAVYRSGTWYINQSSNNQTATVQFGLSGDIPAPADYDGDGRADIAVWRTSNQTFYAQNSSNGALQSPVLGVSSTEPVPADYDGDGKANFAVKSGANWVILNTNFTQIQTTSWQQSGDKAVQNDYDGDGKVDIAVWRNADGNWFIRQSSRIGQSNELRQVQWGVAGDIPVPAYYRR